MSSNQHENEMPKKGPALRIVLTTALMILLALGALYLFKPCDCKDCKKTTTEEVTHPTTEKAMEAKADSASKAKVDSIKPAPAKAVAK